MSKIIYMPSESYKRREVIQNDNSNELECGSPREGNSLSITYFRMNDAREYLRLKETVMHGQIIEELPQLRKTLIRLDVAKLIFVIVKAAFLIMQVALKLRT